MKLKVSDKKSIIYQTIVITIISCMLSAYMSFFIRILFSMPVNISDIIITFAIPLIVTPILIYIILEQSHQLYHSKKQIEDLVNKDCLTQIYNKRYFETFAEEIFHSGKKCAIILIDIDDFKVINDKYGHLAGDFVMKETAAIIKSELRETDIVARIGGDEFAVICANADSGYGRDIAERIRKKVEKTKMQYMSNIISITISVGCVSNEDTQYTLDEYIRNADNALYKSKGNGKNKVTFFHSA